MPFAVLMVPGKTKQSGNYLAFGYISLELSKHI